MADLFKRAKHVYRLIFGPMPLHEFDDYEAYWEERGKAPKRLHRYESISSRIRDGESVLDVGCGDGAFLEFLREDHPRSRLFGVDLSEEAIRRLQSRDIAGRQLRAGDTLRSRVDGQFDHVVMMEVIEHVHDAEKLVRDALELEPGSMFITIPNAGYLQHRLRLMFGGRFPVTFIMYHMKEHIRFWTVKDFLQWAEYLGLEVIDYEGQERTTNFFKLRLIRWFPALCAAQMIYHLRPAQGASGTRASEATDGRESDV